MINEHTKPGDVIKITNPDSDCCGCEKTVVEWPNGFGRQDIEVGEVCCLSHDRYYIFFTKTQYEIVKRAGKEQAAQPGDTIVITANNAFQGQKFRAVECPEKYRGGSYSHCAWVSHHDRIISVTHGYEIVEKNDSCLSGANSIDDNLKKQRDDNLREIFC